MSYCLPWPSRTWPLFSKALTKQEVPHVCWHAPKMTSLFCRLLSFKVQLLLKCPFGAFKTPKKPTNAQWSTLVIEALFDSPSLPKNFLYTLLPHLTISCSESFKKRVKNHHFLCPKCFRYAPITSYIFFISKCLMKE